MQPIISGSTLYTFDNFVNNQVQFGNRLQPKQVQRIPEKQSFFFRDEMDQNLTNNQYTNN